MKGFIPAFYPKLLVQPSVQHCHRPCAFTLVITMSYFRILIHRSEIWLRSLKVITLLPQLFKVFFLWSHHPNAVVDKIRGPNVSFYCTNLLSKKNLHLPSYILPQITLPTRESVPVDQVLCSRFFLPARDLSGMQYGMISRSPGNQKFLPRCRMVRSIYSRSFLPSPFSGPPG